MEAAAYILKAKSRFYFFCDSVRVANFTALQKVKPSPQLLCVFLTHAMGISPKR